MIKVINLKMNGIEFDPCAYTKGDNLEAILVSSNYEVATVKVTSLRETFVTLHSKRKEASEDFMHELVSIEKGDCDAVAYLINGYQEYKYPFVENDANIVAFPTACGITANNTPNIIIKDPQTNELTTIWYYTSFNTKGDALEFLKSVFERGVKNDEIGLDSTKALWLNLQERFN